MKKSLFLSLFALLLVATGCKKEVESVTVMPESIILSVGETYQLQSVVKPDKAPQEVRWMSSNPEVATVNAGGLVTAVAAGECEISVYADVQKSTCRVKVTTNCIPVAGVTLDKISLPIVEGDVAQLTATVKPDNATNRNVNWSSSDNTVATVSAGGKVTAVKEGTATIIVTTEDGGKTATCAVTVLENIEDALLGVFSVSESKKVRFSKGNLVATINASGAPTAWKFTAHQYDCLGENGANKTIGIAAGDVDLFGWSTAATNYGISTSTNDYNLGNFVDWGKAYCEKNNITPDNTWRTLSRDEWVYLFKTRTNASSLYKCGVTVCGKDNCLIIAPDNWNTSANPLQTSYDATAWATAEAAGLVCLPAAGRRDGSNVRDVGDNGGYWSSTRFDHVSACRVYSNSSRVSSPSVGYLHYGNSVRLITDVK